MISIFLANSSCSWIGTEITSRFLRIARLMFFCADSGACSSKIFWKKENQYCIKISLEKPFELKPTTLSGKHALKVNIPVLAILASIVITLLAIIVMKFI